MINTLEDLLTFENIYLIANWGVVPFWLSIIIPSHVLQNFLSFNYVPLLLSVAYIFVAIKFFRRNILEGFNFI